MTQKEFRKVKRKLGCYVSRYSILIISDTINPNSVFII